MEKRIVLTGGPGSGKTTVLNSIVNIYSSLGVKVIVVSETATEIINSGIKPFGDDKIDLLDFQELVLSLQLSKEKLFDRSIELYKKSHPDKDILVIYDRGAIDNKAYINDKDFNSILNQVCQNSYSSILNKYDLVIDLIGAKSFYTLENNHARSESADVALELGEKTLKSWTGHPKVKIVSPKEKMEDKVAEVISYINELLDKKTLKKQKKYFIDINESDLNYLFENGVSSFIEQCYLVSSKDEEKRVRKTTINESTSYELTVYEKNESGKMLKSSKSISEKIYNELKEFKIPDSSDIRKYRVYFTYEDTYMYADVFVDGEKYEEYGYLEINLSGGQSVNIPPFIKVLKDVSDDQNYDNYTKAVGEKSAELKKVIL